MRSTAEEVAAGVDLTGKRAIVTGGALAIVAGLNLRPESGVVAVLAAAGITGLIRRYAMRQIGGQTGDICGATQVLVEITMFVVFLAMIG